jgi:hypothetical protein
MTAMEGCTYNASVVSHGNSMFLQMLPIQMCQTNLQVNTYAEMPIIIKITISYA